MSIKRLLLFLLVSVVSVSYSQNKLENSKIILITLDGFRWQELFAGADEKLIVNEEYVSNPDWLKNKYWLETAKERREALLPFIWNEVVKMGQIHGNIELGSKVTLTNKMWFSYPGYNEILSGKADDERITSNDKFNNPNKTVLELVNSRKEYNGNVAAFGSWDVFPYIINETRSGVPVNAGYENAIGDDLTDREELLNEMQDQTPVLWGTVRLDAFTHNFAKEYMKKKHPELLYISYGETDDFAHQGKYKSYITSANRTDAMIKDLWEFTQQDPFYKGNTVFIITSDHGRGTQPIDNWRHHGSNIKGADQVWIIAFGNNVEALGEIDKNEQLYSTQVAPTILKLLGIPYDNTELTGAPLNLLMD
ncbi:alkaline phosphatase family protein [Urechidicola vernalis]|uniref:Alkaline phosphatase family protein n=1 Tax=Urechidicola vernalis TaxID=3075600 RepID=A0ABU2Y5P9_9FLAO|nr:alkaline phosphatase family protein [Urechidicola sp. P050]MDT0553095.1 alkaline phosphatase family protein [Urechidicola sp. P050]